MRIATTYFQSAITQQSISAFTRQLRELLRERPREIHISISTSGGLTSCSLELYNFIKRKHPCPIFTHNVGNIESAGIVIFLSGVHRYASPTSLFKFHANQYYFNNEAFNSSELMQLCENLEDYDNMVRKLVCENTKLDQDTVMKYMNKARVIRPQEALENGLIHEIR